jgi:hypothetical protein
VGAAKSILKKRTLGHVPEPAELIPVPRAQGVH